MPDKQKPQRDFILPERGRSPEHLAMMKAVHESGKCPFCQDNFLPQTQQPIRFENDFWVVVENVQPYEHTKTHLVIISREHAESLNDLCAEAGRDLWIILQDIERFYQISSGAMFMRFGDPVYNGGSVHHLHAQLIVPDIGTDKNWDKLKVKLGSNPK